MRHCSWPVHWLGEQLGYSANTVSHVLVSAVLTVHVLAISLSVFKEVRPLLQKVTWCNMAHVGLYFLSERLIVPQNRERGCDVAQTKATIGYNSNFLTYGPLKILSHAPGLVACNSYCKSMSSIQYRPQLKDMRSDRGYV